MLKAIEIAERTERQAQMIVDASELACDVGADSKLMGYVMLAFYEDGTTRSAGYRPSPSDNKMGSTMFEAWALQTMKAHFAYREGVDAANAVLNGDA